MSIMNGEVEHKSVEAENIPCTACGSTDTITYVLESCVATVMLLNTSCSITNAREIVACPKTVRCFISNARIT
jgi:hypothetical protein